MASRCTHGRATPHGGMEQKEGFQPPARQFDLSFGSVMEWLDFPRANNAVNCRVVAFEEDADPEDRRIEDLAPLPLRPAGAKCRGTDQVLDLEMRARNAIHQHLRR